MISNRIRGWTFDGLREIDTRRTLIGTVKSLPRKLYILDSDPLTYNELLEVLSHIIDAMNANPAITWGDDITDGFWSLKYLIIIPKDNNTFYMLNRYCKKINWKKILTA